METESPPLRPRLYTSLGRRSDHRPSSQKHSIVSAVYKGLPAPAEIIFLGHVGAGYGRRTKEVFRISTFPRQKRQLHGTEYERRAASENSKVQLVAAPKLHKG